MPFIEYIYLTTGPSHLILLYISLTFRSLPFTVSASPNLSMPPLTSLL